MRRGSERGRSLGLVLVLAAILTLGVFAPGANAETLSSLDGTVGAVVSTPDQTDPSPTPEPSPEPSPDPSPDPAPEARGSTGDPAVTASTGSFDPGGESTIAESTQDGSGDVSEDEKNVRGSIGSWIHSVASILNELASTADVRVRAADGTSLCPGSDCGSTFNRNGFEALTFILICVILAVAGTIAILAGRRRSTLWKLATIERWTMLVWWETRRWRKLS